MDKQKLSGIIMVPVVFIALFLAYRSYRSTLAPEPAGAGPQRSQSSGGGAPAQSQGPTPAQRMDEMAKEVSLTPEQKTQISAIQDDLAAKRKAFPKDMPRETRRAQMTANRAAADVKIKALLSPDQQTKYDALQAKRRAQMAAMRPGGGGGGGASVTPKNRPGGGMPGSGGPMGGSGGGMGGSGGGMGGKTPVRPEAVPSGGGLPGP
jgi:protein CpxP